MGWVEWTCSRCMRAYQEVRDYIMIRNQQPFNFTEEMRVAAPFILLEKKRTVKNYRH